MVEGSWLEAHCSWPRRASPALWPGERPRSKTGPNAQSREHPRYPRYPGSTRYIGTTVSSKRWVFLRERGKLELLCVSRMQIVLFLAAGIQQDKCADQASKKYVEGLLEGAWTKSKAMKVNDRD